MDVNLCCRRCGSAAEELSHVFWSFEHFAEVWNYCNQSLGLDVSAEIANSSLWALLMSNKLGRGSLGVRRKAYVVYVL